MSRGNSILRKNHILIRIKSNQIVKNVFEKEDCNVLFPLLEKRIKK